MEFTTKNGANVLINIAPFKDSLKLKNTIQKALLKQGVDIANIDIKNFKFDSVNEILQMVMAVDSDEEVQKAILICLERCAYNLVKITENTFDDVNARADYYEIIVACLKENLLPFFQNLSSLFTGLAKKKEEKLDLK